MVDQTTHDVMVAQTAEARTLLDYFQGHRNVLEADRVAHGQAVAAELGNLSDIADGRIRFSATWNPDEQNPTNVRGGVFADLSILLANAADGAFIVINLLAGKTYPIDKNYPMRLAQKVMFVGDSTNPPRVEVHNHVSDGQNTTYWMRVRRFGTISFNSVNVTFLPKSDPNLGWSSLNGLIAALDGGMELSVGLAKCTVSGPSGLDLVVTFLGELTKIMVTTATVDGDISLVRVSSAVAIISKSGLNLTNGAAVHSGGTVGTNVFIN